MLLCFFNTNRVLFTHNNNIIISCSSCFIIRKNLLFQQAVAGIFRIQSAVLVSPVQPSIDGLPRRSLVFLRRDSRPSFQVALVLNQALCGLRESPGVLQKHVAKPSLRDMMAMFI